MQAWRSGMTGAQGSASIAAPDGVMLLMMVPDTVRVYSTRDPDDDPTPRMRVPHGGRAARPATG
jgi:hypothetical protein